jgi:hypothetical protein
VSSPSPPVDDASDSAKSEVTIEMTALLNDVAALLADAPGEQHAGLRARLERVQKLSLSSDSVSSPDTTTVDASVSNSAATVGPTAHAGSSSSSSSVSKKKKSRHGKKARASDDDASESQSVCDVIVKDGPNAPLLAAAAADTAPAPQLRAWKQRATALSSSPAPHSTGESGIAIAASNTLKRSVQFALPTDAAATAAVAGDTATSAATPAPAPADDGTLRKWKRNMNKNAASAELAASPPAAGAGEPTASVPLAQSQGSIRRWKGAMTGEQADAFKRVTEEKYGRSHSLTDSSQAAAAAAAAAAATSSTTADEEDTTVSKEVGVPRKASRLLARFRREKSSDARKPDASASASQLSASSASASSSSSQVLGVQLSELPASTSVPDFVLLAVSHLEANGLSEEVMFNCTDEAAISELERKIECGELSDLAAYKNAEVVAALIKRFLLRLPTSLVENHLLDNFVACLAIENRFELCIELDALLHQMPCRELHLLRFLLAFVHGRAKSAEAPFVCHWRSAEQLGACFVRGSDARRSAACAVTWQLLQLYEAVFDPPVLRVQYLREPDIDAFVIHSAQPIVLLRKLVSPVWQDMAMVRRILLTHPTFVASHTLLEWFAYELRRADRALQACPGAETSVPARTVQRLARAVGLVLPLVSKEHVVPAAAGAAASTALVSPRARAESVSSGSPKRQIANGGAETGNALGGSGGSGGAKAARNGGAGSMVIGKKTSSMRLPPLAMQLIGARTDDAPEPSLLQVSPKRTALQPASAIVVAADDEIQVALLELARVAEKCSHAAAKTLAFDIVSKHLRPLGSAPYLAHIESEKRLAEAAAALKSPRVLPTTPRTEATVWAKYAPSDVARELILWDHELFRAIPSREFLRMSFTERETSPLFHAASDRFNEMARWTSTEVLLRDTAQLRAQQIERMMDVAEECRAQCDFQGACAIVMGLAATPVERLSDEWERVSTKRRAKFDKLKATFDMDRNFQAYRDALRAATPPIVPYLALISKYLFAIETHNDDFFEPQVPERGAAAMLQVTPVEAPKVSIAAVAAAAASADADLAAYVDADAPRSVRELTGDRRLVNCDKMLMLAQLITEVESYQSSLYPHASNAVLRAALVDAPIMTEEELFARSNLYRPGRARAPSAATATRRASALDSDAVVAAVAAAGDDGGDDDEPSDIESAESASVDDDSESHE